MDILDFPPKTRAVISVARMRDVQNIIDNFEKDKITPAKLLVEYVKHVIGDADMNVLSPEGWDMALLEVIDTDNFRAVFGIIPDDEINEAIRTATQNMKGHVQFNINAYYVDKHISI